MTTVVRLDDRLVTLVKGAPETILQNSTHYLAADGSSKPLTHEARQAVEAALRDSAGRAMRTLALRLCTAAGRDTGHRRGTPETA